MELASIKLWITKAMITKMEERRIAKPTNVREYLRLNNQLRRETDRLKEVYMEEICEEIFEFWKKDIWYHVSKGIIKRKN